PLKPNEWHHVFATYDGSGKAAGLRLYVDGVLQERRTVFADTLKSSIHTTVPLKIGQRHTTARLDNVGIQDVRIYSRALPSDEVARLAGNSRMAWVASRPADKRTPKDIDELFGWWLPENDLPYRTLLTKQTGLQQEETAIKARGTIAHVMQEKPQESMAYV